MTTTPTGIRTKAERVTAEQGHHVASTERIMSTARFLLGFAVVYGILAGLAELQAPEHIGILILASVLLAAVGMERVLGGVAPRAALRLLGLGRPDPRALVVAASVSILVLGAYPLVSVVADTHLVLKPGWPWLLMGIFAFHGLAEELVWRGYAFRRLRRNRSFGAAVVASMPLVVAAHVPIVFNSGLTVGIAAMVVAAATSLSLAHLFELGGRTVWAPAIVHTAIDSFKLVTVPDEAAQTFSLVLAALGVAVPMLAFVSRTRHAPTAAPALSRQSDRQPPGES